MKKKREENDTGETPMGNIIFLTTAIGGRPILAMNFDRRPVSTIPILMNTSNREVFNWGSLPMFERKGEKEREKKGRKKERKI